MARRGCKNWEALLLSTDEHKGCEELAGQDCAEHPGREESKEIMKQGTELELRNWPRVICTHIPKPEPQESIIIWLDKALSVGGKNEM